MKSRGLKILFAPFPNPWKLICQTFNPRTNVAREVTKRIFRWPSGPAMTYEDAARKYRINDFQLKTEIIPSLQRLRRIATVMMYLAVAPLAAGIVIENFNMIMMATFSVILCALQAASQQYRLYIIEHRKVMSILVFFADRPAIKQIFWW